MIITQKLADNIGKTMLHKIYILLSFKAKDD